MVYVLGVHRDVGPTVSPHPQGPVPVRGKEMRLKGVSIRSWTGGREQSLEGMNTGF